MTVDMVNLVRQAGCDAHLGLGELQRQQPRATKQGARLTHRCTRPG